ncbi:hypothetical protein ACIBCA_25150 [Kitasatospora sp. NPDC051170]
MPATTAEAHPADTLILGNGSLVPAGGEVRVRAASDAAAFDVVEIARPAA